MAFEYKLIDNAGTRARKETVVEMGRMAMVVPAMRNISYVSSVVTANPAGLPVPNASPSLIETTGSMDAGTYLYAVTYYDSDTNTERTASESRGSATREITTSGGSDGVRVILPSVSNHVTNSRLGASVGGRFRVYRSQAGGTVLLRTASTAITTSSVTDTNSDATIAARDDLKVDTQAYSPPVADTYGFTVKHGSRVFMMGPARYYDFNSDYARRATWSIVDSIDAFPSANVVDLPTGQGGPIRSAGAQGDSLIVYQEEGIWLWLYKTDPDGLTGDGSLQQVNTTRGCLTFKTLVNIDGSHFVMDRNGWFLYRGGQTVVDMTDPIRPLLDRINWEQKAQFSGAADDTFAYWSVALDDDDECKYLVVLDVKRFQAGQPVWWVWHMPMGVRDMTTYEEPYKQETNTEIPMLAQKRVVFLSSKGVAFVMNYGLRDGIADELTATGYLTSASSSTAFTDTAATFQSSTSFLNVRGAYVKFDDPAATDRYYISSTAKTVLYTGGIGTTLAKSTAYTIGGVKTEWQTGWMDMGTLDKKIGLGMEVSFEPNAVSFPVRMSIARDRSGFGAHRTSTTQTGWSVDSNSPNYLNVDMGGNNASNGRTGLTEVPVGGKNFNEASVKFHSDRVDSPWVINGFQIKPRNRKSDR